jgi:hypothetical protein
MAILVGVVILGMGGLGPVIPWEATAGATDRAPEGIQNVTHNESSVQIDVNCDRHSVAVVLPEENRYDVTVGVANLTPTSNSVSRSTLGSIKGNTTVEFEEEGIVFTVVQNQSANGEIVATDLTNCGKGSDMRTEEATPGTETPGRTITETESATEIEPAVEIDCENDSVRFDTSERTEYVAKVTMVSLSVTGTSTSSSTQTLEGNETVPIETDGLIAAFASTGELGDDRTASAIRNCSAFGTDENSTDVTAAESI